ncbi:MAG: S-layer homology domain-containing protein [Acidimicrobiaceae bacterium]|nr:S-layer homology domain-containing protein [Acidimicrobiia bacterium]MCY4494811.1 S-layer homology domain-containing protein [Acidimicrobiaceae bacterium]
MRLRAAKALLTAIVVFGLLGSAVVASPVPASRSDSGAVPYYRDAVVWAQGAGVVTGCVALGDSVSRGEVIAVLHKSLGEPAARSRHRFLDITAGELHIPVAWAANSGITRGTSPTTFSPDDPTTRAQVAAFLWRVSGQPDSRPSWFVDVKRDWQSAPVGWMAAERITTGRSATFFDPDAAVTWAELLTFVWRWLGSPPSATGEPYDCEASGERCSGLFDGAFVAEIAAAHRGARFTAAVHDLRTGCWYHLNPDLAITTASVIKAQVLAGVLLAAQEGGRPLSASEVADIELMMHYSHNTPPTSRLYIAVGGAAGMEALDARFAIAGTSHTGRYGATVSTAEDRTVLVEKLLVGGGPLDAASVAAAWATMSGVSAAQSWGVTAGLPDGYEAALKNGFYPLRGSGWRVGTTGVVRDPDGGAYAMTVMTDQNPDESTGIALVEAITAHVNSALSVGEAAVRAVDSVTCVAASASSSWSSLADTLAHPALALRHLNGGQPTPLTGQRICRP